MSTTHLCLNHPDLEDDGERWRPGSVDHCSYHGPRVVNMTRVRMSAKDRRKADQANGVVGEDRGGYING